MGPAAVTVGFCPVRAKLSPVGRWPRDDPGCPGVDHQGEGDGDPLARGCRGPMGD